LFYGKLSNDSNYPTAQVASDKLGLYRYSKLDWGISRGYLMLPMTAGLSNDEYYCASWRAEPDW
jgi:hypothetical protein